MTRHARGRFLLARLSVLLCVMLGACAPEQVLTISRFELSVPGQAQPLALEIPKHLDVILPPRQLEYQLYTEVQLPASLRGRTLTLAIPLLLARCRLFVNGNEMVELDPPATNLHRGRGTVRFRIPAHESDHSKLDLTLRVRHTWTQSGWLDTPWRMSATVAGDKFSHFVESFNRQGAWIGLSTVLVAGLLALLICLLDRRQVAFAWFTLQAFLGASMPLFQTGTGTEIFGVYDTVMMATGVSTALWASVRFTHSQFGLGTPHRVLDVLLGVTLLLIASAPGPFTATGRAAATVIGFVSVNVVYQIVTTARLWSHETYKVPARVLAISWAALGIAAGPDQLAWIGLGEVLGGVRAGPLGLAAVAVLQLAVVSHDYVRTLKRTDVLNLELASRVRSLEQKDLENSALNEALQRQIAARSEQLAHAIVRLGSARSMVVGELAIGSVIENRYRILGILGRGGMGTVYEVERLLDRNTFALKVLSGRGGAVEMARFAREAQLVAQLQHPNVVSIVDVDVATNGLLFIVLELVRGKTLREHMERAASDRGFALQVLAQVAAGMNSIHERRIVHRDLKPDNILVIDAANQQPLQVKITDFGVSVFGDGAPYTAGSQTNIEPAEPVTRPLGMEDLTVQLTPGGGAPNAAAPSGGDSDQALTQAGTLIGTPRYMAPEAIEVTAAAGDVYAFGVIAFEMLSGTTPFAEPRVMLRLAGRPMSAVPALRATVPDLSSALATLVERCLSEDASVRPSAAELARALIVD